MVYNKQHGKHNFKRNRGNSNYKNFRNDKNREKKTYYEKENKVETFYNSLNENELGITEYIGITEGFNGIIKSRYSDFHVNEIDIDENIAILSDFTIPKPVQQEDIKNLNSENHLIESNLLSKDDWAKIKVLLDSNIDVDYEFVELDVTELDKNLRTEIHTNLKKHYGKAIVTNTVARDDKKFIKCTRFNKSIRGDVREKWLWPHQYTYFILYKENIDTMKAAMLLAQSLNCKPAFLTYAGTKDKRAKTSQWFCMKRRNPEIIAKAASSIPCIHVGNFTFKPETLKLGQLLGNRFKIAIRNITADEEIVQKSLESIKNKGFINYYGLQRFGNCATVPTYKIGQALLKGKWKEACELILMPREGEPNFMTKMREFWTETRDASAALKMLRFNNKTVEAKLLAGLAKNNGNDFVGALGNIPRNMRLLYVHSYQSLIWNKVVSRRLKEWGQTLHVGDLVFANDHVEKENPLVDEIVDHLIEDDIDDTIQNDEIIDDEEISSFKALAKALTKEDIDSNKFSIFDLVLPLPGHDILYPNNESEKWYEEYLAEDNLKSEDLKQKIKLYSLTGAYRRVFVKPKNLEWRIMKYNSNEDSLILSDLEIMKEQNLIDFKDGNLKALILEFNLPSSCYATMALREILKIDTSTSNQIKLTSLIEKSNVKDENIKEESSQTNKEENNSDSTSNVKHIEKRKINVDDESINDSIEKKIKIE